MKIVISNSSGEPIYLQIADQIKTQILEGKLSAGEALPSMRNLATELRISFMTTKRAYEELEQDGYIESFTGKGSFVKGQNPQMYREEQLRRIEMLLEEACGRARKAGVTIEELQEMVDVFYGGEGR
ncbi:MAG: GntR family transcriptional regulator [Lachnospiraceae bacterium]|nr:GntR family transcriptional regulator [Lachnospiraceae bacterium]